MKKGYFVIILSCQGSTKFDLSNHSVMSIFDNETVNLQMHNERPHPSQLLYKYFFMYFLI